MSRPERSPCRSSEPGSGFAAGTASNRCRTVTGMCSFLDHTSVERYLTGQEGKCLYGIAGENTHRLSFFSASRERSAPDIDTVGEGENGLNN